MFIINCPQCEAQHLATNTQILSVHRTSEGMVGYVRCASGHTVMHRFANPYSKPKPPASVIALQNEALQIEALEQVAETAA